jgi:hypothetical protein
LTSANEESNAQTWLEPAVNPTAVEMPKTSTGTSEDVIEVSPNSPSELSPQHLIAPDLSKAQVWKFPAAIAATPERPRTDTGLVTAADVVLSPTNPNRLAPQHFTVVDVSNAQV